MFGNMVVRYMANSDPWGPPGTPFMTIFLCFMSTLKFPIFKILKQMRSTNPERYLIFVLIKFPFECRQNHVWGPIFEPSYDHIYKNIHFCKGNANFYQMTSLGGTFVGT